MLKTEEKHKAIAIAAQDDVFRILELTTKTPSMLREHKGKQNNLYHYLLIHSELRVISL